MTDFQTPKLVKRKIKEKIKALLTGKTTAQDRVYISRSIPTDVEDETTILIYTTDETIEDFEAAPKRYRRRMTVRIECVDIGNNDDDLDLRLETLGEAVETAMELDETLASLVNRIFFTGTEYRSDSNGESPTGLLALLYDIEFFTYAPAFGSDALEDFNRLDTTLRHKQGEDNVVDAQDTVTF